MLPTQKEVLAFITPVVQEMRVWAEERFDIDLAKLRPQFTFKATNRLGLAGGDNKGTPTLRLNLGGFIRDEVIGVREYASYAAKYEIGSFATKDWKIAVIALAAHEMSHVVQWALKSSTVRPDVKVSRLYEKTISKMVRRKMTITHKFEGLGDFEPGHGDFFQRIYREFRRKFVNHLDIEPALVPRWFNVTSKEVVERLVKPQHRFMGMSITYKGRVYVVQAMDPSKRKYRWIGVANDGKRLLIDDQTLVLTGKAA